MTDRRDAILALAQHELLYSHHRRAVRRRAVTGGAAVAVIAAITTTAILLRPAPAPMPELAGGPAANSHTAPATAPGTSHAQLPSPSGALAIRPAPPEPPPIPSRIEIASNASPTPGFAEVVDDGDLSTLLSQLTTPTGVAVIAGRTHLVSNPPPGTGERLH